MSYLSWACLLAAFAAVVVVARSYLRLRGARLIRCPETRDYAAVKLDAARAVRTGWLGRQSFRLRECSRWPERRDCGQECLAQIEAAPDGCLVRTILAEWYEGKRCIYCRRPFGRINWMEHRPAMLNAEGRTVEWDEIQPDEVPHALECYEPVCWNCHVAETFRHTYPDLVVDRDWKGRGEHHAGE